MLHTNTQTYNDDPAHDLWYGAFTHAWYDSRQGGQGSHEAPTQFS